MIFFSLSIYSTVCTHTYIHYLSIYLSIYIYWPISFCLSIYLSIYLFFYLFYGCQLLKFTSLIKLKYKSIYQYWQQLLSLNIQRLWGAHYIPVYTYFYVYKWLFYIMHTHTHTHTHTHIYIHTHMQIHLQQHSQTHAHQETCSLIFINNENHSLSVCGKVRISVTNSSLGFYGLVKQ